MRRSSMESNWTLPSFSTYVLFAWLGGAKGIGLLLVLRIAKQSKIAWKPPSKGEVKFNTDGAIETDSKLVVEWQLILSRLKLCKDLEWQISHIPRECNSCADSLAKRGIRQPVDYCEVWQDL
ncbi:hypothetical protein V6N13_043142 [Hibiscus sabdariffa]